tara:strand:+ start:979 stop:2040 length:1062 start_codon:yes stop_codon:yes gene_type:complete
MIEYILDKNKTFREALKQLEKNSEKCLIITKNNNLLVGTLTDGDIRRAILNGAGINSNIYKYVKKNPVFLKYNDYEKDAQDFLKNKKVIKIIQKINDDHIDLIPLINSQKQVKKIIFRKNLKKYFKPSKKLKDVQVLIMAGGRGKRLKEFTNFFPKPLVPINNETALENIMNNFSKYGVRKFFVSLHYKKNLIKSYLKENNIKNVKFLNERIPLGTAGSISLLKGKIKNDFFLINCDTILSINMEKFYEFHKKNNFHITLVAASKNFQISYGACQINKKNGQLKKISEKPNFNYLVSVGLYLIKPSVIKAVSNNKHLDMDILLKKVKSRGGKVGVFPISENSWRDIGSLAGID